VFGIEAWVGRDGWRVWNWILILIWIWIKGNGEWGRRDMRDMRRDLERVWGYGFWSLSEVERLSKINIKFQGQV
jgi:hypothetical protein